MAQSHEHLLALIHNLKKSASDWDAISHLLGSKSKLSYYFGKNPVDKAFFKLGSTLVYGLWKCKDGIILTEGNLAVSNKILHAFKLWFNNPTSKNVFQRYTGKIKKVRKERQDYNFKVIYFSIDYNSKNIDSHVHQ